MNEVPKILLVAVNASYMHTNIAIRSLKYFAEEYFNKGENLILDSEASSPVQKASEYTSKASCTSEFQIETAEFTINQPVGEILRSIAFSGADLVMFSTYIWNASVIKEIIPDVKKLLPECMLGAGGPEFSYCAKKYLQELPSLDFIIFGEGELAFVELIKVLLNKSALKDSLKSALPEAFADIKSLYFRRKDNTVIYTGDRPLLSSLDDLPFNYPELKKPEENQEFINHKILYYESSRGCPYSCSYCLSSVDKRVRFKSLEQTCKELQIFLDANVPLVKFVDRTYNLKPERYIKIWQYILSHHNGKTMFHFEIEAEYLNDSALEFLRAVPEGVMQFEIGVQTSNKKTLEAINRSPNIEILAENIRRIPRTIHQHLDLIAGLPYEDLSSFGKSYDFVMDLKPDALQLGFLKVLPGTQMEHFAKKNDWKWQENPVYETFSTPYLNFKDVAFLKEIEILTDAYWNSGFFAYTLNYAFRKISPWHFMCELHSFADENNAFIQARKTSYWFDLFAGFIKDRVRVWNTACGVPKEWSESGSVEHPTAAFAAGTPEIDSQLLYELLRYDFVRSGKKGNFPVWYNHRYDKEKHRLALEKEGLLHNCRIAFSYTEYEEFDWEVQSENPEGHKNPTALLIRYD